MLRAVNQKRPAKASPENVGASNKSLHCRGRGFVLA